MLLLIPVFLPVISGTIILIKKWKKKPWRRPRFILISSLINSAVVLGFLIAQYSEVLTVTLTESVSFRLLPDGLGSVLAGCMAVLAPLVLCYFLDFGEEKGEVPEVVRANAPLSRAEGPKKNVRKKETNVGKEEAEGQKTEGKRDILSARFNYLFAAATGIAFSKNAATLSFFLILLLIVAAWMAWKNGTSGKWQQIISAGGIAAMILVLVVAVFGGNGAEFYFDGYLSGNISNQVLLVLYVLGFCGCSARALTFPFFPGQKETVAGKNLLLDAIFAFLLIRLTFSVFGVSLLRGSWAQVVVTLIAVVGIIVHAVLALREKELQKKLLHLYGASFALILTGIAVMTSHGYVAAVWMLVAFVSVQMLIIFFQGAAGKKEEMGEEFMTGLGRRMPVTFGCFLVAFLSVSATAPFAGFLSAWKLAKAFIRQGGLNYLSMAAMFSFFFLAVFSLYPIVVRAFFPKSEPVEKIKIDEAGPQMLVPMVVLAVAVIAVGFFSGPLGEYIYQIGLGLS